MRIYLNYKILIKIILICTLASVFIPLSSMAGSDIAMIKLTISEKAWFEKHPKINIGIMNNWPPLNFVDEYGKPNGIGVDYLNVINNRLGGVLVIEPAPFKDNYDKVQNKTLDALMDITPKKEREVFFEFTKPYLSIPHVIVGRKTGQKYQSEDDLKGETVALEKGYYNITYFRKNYPEIDIKEYDSTGWALDAVSRGEADAYAGNRAVANYIIEKELLANLSIHGILNKSPVILTIGVRKDWPILATILDKALASISNEEKHAIHRKWIEAIEEKINLTDEEKKWLKRHKIIRIGVDPLFAPFEIVTADNKYKGIGANYIRLIEKRIGLKMELVPDLSWKEVINKTKKREIDLLPCIGVTEARKKFLLFTEPYLSFPRVIITRVDSDEKNLDNIKTLKVAVQENSSHHGFIKEQTKVKPYLFDTFQEAMHALSMGEVEAVVGNLAVATYTIQTQNLTNLKIAKYVSKEPFPLAIAVRKDWPELVSILNKALDSISKESQFNLINEWIDIDYATNLLPYLNKIKLSAREKTWLEKHKEVRLGIDPSWPPFDFVDELGVHQGISSDYVSRVQSMLDVNITPQKGLSWAEMMDEAKRGNIDIIPSIVQTKERSEYLLFTKPYLEIPNVLVTKDDMPIIGHLSEMNGKKIAVVRGFAIEEKLKTDFPDIIQIRVNNFEEALKLVSSGVADGAIDTFASIKHSIQKTGLKNLRISATTPYTILLRFAVRKDWPEMVTILDKALATITDTEKKDIQDKWTNLMVRTKTDWTVIWKVITYALTVLILLIGIFIVWNRKLERAVYERTIELNESEKRLNHAQSIAHVGSWRYDIATNTYSASDESYRIFGLEPQSIVEPDSKFVLSLLHPDDREGFETAMHNAILHNKPYNIEYRIIMPDGTSKYVISNGVVHRLANGTPEYLSGTLQDITEQKKASDVLRQSEENLKRGEQLAHIGTWNFDVLSNKLGWSDGVYRIFGLKPQEINSSYKVFLERVHPDDREFVNNAYLDSIKNKKPYDIEHRIILQSGRVRIVREICDTLYDDNGNPIHSTGTVQDITEKKLVEQELQKAHDELEEKVKERTRELEKANIRLKELDRLKSMFIASMSHELRTPLNSIIGFTGIILQGMSGDISDEQREQLEMVYISAKHLLTLITDVIDISKIEAGKIEAFVEEFMLCDIIDEAVLNLKTQIEKKGLSLEINAPDDLVMKTDGRRLLQCIINYISNAVKFTPEGMVTISAREFDDMVEIKVKDTGIGIKKEEIPRLFSSFVRLDSPLKTTVPGTGLGLYLTKKLAIEVLSGEVSAKSVYGEGATFKITIPKELKNRLQEIKPTQKIGAYVKKCDIIL